MKNYVVKVGTRPENARGQYAEFAGNNLHGPFMHDEAVAFADGVQAIWAEIPQEAFVYGTPFTEILRLQDDRTAEQTARNWHLDVDSVL